MKLADLLIDSKIVKDRSEAKRFLVQNSIAVNGKREDCWCMELEKDDVISVTAPNLMRVIRIKGENV